MLTEKLLETAREEWPIAYKGSLIRLITRFSWEVMEVTNESVEKAVNQDFYMKQILKN